MSALATYLDVKEQEEVVAMIAEAGERGAKLMGETDTEKKNVTEWLAFGKDSIHADFLAAPFGKQRGVLGKLNSALLKETFLAGTLSPTAADLVLFGLLHPLLEKLPAKEHLQIAGVVRWFDHMQHLPLLVGKMAQVSIKQYIAPSVLEAASKKGGKGKKGKKEKKEGKKAKKEEEGDLLSKISFLVGKIVKCDVHPGADGLYVEQIDVGEKEPRTIVSGLRNFVSLDVMNGHMVIVMANLKPAKMRGIKSFGMVMCASDEAHEHVELLDVPEGAKIGERCTFAGHEGAADERLNPKKKVWERVAPDLVTDDKCVVSYKGVPMMTSAGIVKAPTMAKSHIG